MSANEDQYSKCNFRNKMKEKKICLLFYHYIPILNKNSLQRGKQENRK